MPPEDPVGGGVGNKRYEGKEMQGEEARGGCSNPAQLQSQLPLRLTELKSRLSLLCGSSSVRLLASSRFPFAPPPPPAFSYSFYSPSFRAQGLPLGAGPVTGNLGSQPRPCFYYMDGKGKQPR